MSKIELTPEQEAEFFGSLPSDKAANLSESLAYLAIAHGLSLERQNWPTRRLLSTVEAAVLEEKGGAEEEAEAAAGLIELRPRGFVGEQVQLEGAQVVGAELVGQPIEVASQFDDGGDVGLLGPRRIVAQPQIIQQTLT